MTGGFFKLSFKALKTMSSGSSRKTGPSLLLFSKTQRASQVALVVENPPANSGEMRDVG